MKIVEEFKKFIARGSVIDLAVGVIIGTAFGKIVSSLVSDIIMPPIGALMKGVNFDSLFFSLNGQSYKTLKDAIDAGAPVIGYGAFLSNCLQFIIVAACVFALVKAINTFYKAEKATTPPTKSEVLLEEIRDLLAKK